jgi:hypothetical protein
MAPAALAVEAPEGVVVLRAQLDAAHVLDPDLGPVSLSRMMMFANSSSVIRRPGALTV